MEDKIYIYLDDIRTPIDPKWIVVRDCAEFKAKVEELGIENINVMSLDHDLGDSAMQEYFNNVAPNYQLNYDNITECTGYDLVKWLIDHVEDNDKDLPQIYTHSANPIGASNIQGLVNNYLKNKRRPQTCIRHRPEHT